MVFMKSIIVFIVIFIYPISIFSQEIGFMGINIGLTREKVMEIADYNPIIHVPKNRDVELFPVEERKILTLSINPEIPNMYLQFYNNKLYSITMIFDEKYIDYYTLCSVLMDKYGEYTELNPDWREWNVNDIKIVVEKPSVVKYIALKEFLDVSGFKKESKYDKNKRIKTILESL